MRWSILSLVMLVVLVIMNNDGEMFSRRLLADRTTNGDDVKCRWVAWKKKNVCVSGNHNIASEVIGRPVPPVANKAHNQPNVITTSYSRPLGYGWRVAVLYHGHYDRRGSRLTEGPSCSDFFLNEANHKQMIFDPLRDVLNASVEVFFHTFHHDVCRDKDDALVAHLKPVSYAFAPHAAAKSTRVVDSYVHVLDQVIAFSDSEQSKARAAPSSPGLDSAQNPHTTGYFLLKEEAENEEAFANPKAPIDLTGHTANPKAGRTSIDPRLFRESTRTAPDWGKAGRNVGKSRDDDSEGSAPVARQKLPLSFYQNGHNRKLMETDNSLVFDAVILCRFDVMYSKPITSLPIVWGGLGAPINNNKPISNPVRASPFSNGPKHSQQTGNHGKLVSLDKPALGVGEVEGTQCLGVNGWVRCGGRKLLSFFNLFSTKKDKHMKEQTTLPIEEPVRIIPAPAPIQVQQQLKPNPFQTHPKTQPSKQRPPQRPGPAPSGVKRPQHAILPPNKPPNNKIPRPPQPNMRVPMEKAVRSTSTNTVAKDQRSPLMTCTYLAWRDERPQWNEKKKVSDLIFISPGTHVRALRQALNTSPGAITSAHFFFPKFAAAVGFGSIKFIDDKRFGSSNIQINTQSPVRRLQSFNGPVRTGLDGKPKPVPKSGESIPQWSFIAINRSCKGKMQDAMVRAASNRTHTRPTCWRGDNRS